MDYLPLFTQLTDRPVLVVGAGEVAYRKIQLLLEAGAKVHVIAKQISPEVQPLIEQQQINWLKKEFAVEDVNAAVITIAATNDAELNKQIFEAGNRYNRLVNVVDNKALCSFIVPAIVDRSPLQIAISTGGASPVLARQLREKLEQELPPYLGELARIADKYRPTVKQTVTQATARRLFWEALFAAPEFVEQVATQQHEAAEQFLLARLSQPTAEVKGHVTLVGAGPGDAGLLTLAGYRALQAADVVLYDALVDTGVLDLIRRDATRVAVGKRAHAHTVAQEQTNQLLVQYAQQGLRVVRLKGGDPFVFGRGAEEVEVLKQAGIRFSIVPGVTAALGATAYAGIPLTHRNYAQSALFITGHCRDEGDEIDWGSIAKLRQTLAIYMGTIKATEISQHLIANGKAADTPVAIISQGTLATQQVQIGILSELGQLAEQAVRPALMVIGEVVQLHEQLQWFGAER